MFLGAIGRKIGQAEILPSKTSKKFKFIDEDTVRICSVE